MSGPALPPPPEPVVATCECGAAYTRPQLLIHESCLVCGTPFVETGTKAPVLLDLGACKQRALELVRDGDADGALLLVAKDAPQLFRVIGELARAVVALNGECLCDKAVIFGEKPDRDEVCPHLRAARALRGAGITDEAIAQLRNTLPVRIR